MVASIATCISVALIFFTARANNRRKRKEITIQYSDAHSAYTEGKIAILDAEKINGVIGVDAVKNNESLRDTVEKYLFAMERLSVGINTNVLDIYVFDRIMGQKTIEHFNALKSYIEHIQKEDYAAKYSEFEELVDKLHIIRNKRFPKSKEHPKGNLSRFLDG
jgi:predicted hydrocarbon binding protein